MSFQLKKILVPVDFSETGMLALEHAGHMAGLAKADLLLLHVMTVNQYHFEIPEPELHIENFDRLNAIVEDRLNEAVEMVRQRYGVVAKSMSARGSVSREVTEVAADENIDLVIMGTHGAKGFEELFIGSNAHKVVSMAKCPVITVQTHAKRIGFTNIVLPIDRTAHSREKVDIALRFGSLYDAKIHILGLFEASEDQREYDKLQIVLDQVQHAVEHAKLRFTRQTVKGTNLATEAMRFGPTVEADLIVIMTEQESALTGLFLGPRAKQIVNHSRIPVMSIKPKEGIVGDFNLDGSTGAF
ncbi:MAG: universal stress protein [Bacteroidia bacterium]|jgi:nucleotide-binding universal stress UspA family protein|nr:universal stress protein [Bacteroidia bacterium]